MTGGEGPQLLFQPPLWAAGGYLRPYFWDHKAGPSRIIRKGGIRAATDQDCPMIYDLPIQKYLSFIHWSYFGSGLGATFATVCGSGTRCGGVDDSAARS